MPRSLGQCATPGCPDVTAPGVGKCELHAARTTRDQRAAHRPYTTRGHTTRFRQGVLQRDPWCVLCAQVGALTPATVADHYPHTRRRLIDLGLDPDDPANGRGLCKPCHDKHTARTSPGGWAADR